MNADVDSYLSKRNEKKKCVWGLFTKTYASIYSEGGENGGGENIMISYEREGGFGRIAALRKNAYDSGLTDLGKT